MLSENVPSVLVILRDSARELTGTLAVNRIRVTRGVGTLP
jgi:hypothetical protein